MEYVKSTGKGIPDVDNLKVILKVLNVSIDFLLDDEEVIDKTVIKEQINLDDYVKEGQLRSKKDAVVYSKYPNADICNCYRRLYRIKNNGKENCWRQV